MAAIRGAWTLQNVNSAYHGRLHDGAFLAATNLVGAAGQPNATWRAGVLPSINTTTSQPYPVDLLVVANTSPAMNVLVYQGSAVLPRAGQGPYVAYSDSTPTITVAASNPTNARIDVVYMQVLDAAVGDGSTQAKIDIVTGTPSGTPAVPSIPTNAIPLAQIAVAANATQIISANITDVRKSAGVRGAVRQLLPGDQLSDAGYVVGELRSRWSAAYSTYLIDYWGNDGQWHGTQSLMPSYAWQNGTSNITIAQTPSKTGIIAATIPDPGWPYQVRCAAQIDWGNTGAFTAGNAPWVIGLIALDSVGGTGLQAANGFSQATSGALDGWTPIPSRTYSTVLTGAHSIYLVGQESGTTIFTAFSSYPTNTYLDVEIIPV